MKAYPLAWLWTSGTMAGVALTALAVHAWAGALGFILLSVTLLAFFKLYHNSERGF